jgi:glucose-1-phosphate thymidylyltransferase
MKRPLRGVVLAAGDGVRMMPLTAQRPKPMLPVACKPLLAYNLEQLADAGAEEAVVVIRPRDEAIRRHFGDRWRELRLHYVEQHETRGTGHALYLARDFIAGEPFLCIYGDNLTTWPAAHLLPVHRDTGATATLALFRAADPRRHGVVELQGGQVRRIVEKPANPASNLACAGMFVFEPELLDALDCTEPARSGELQLTDAIQLLVARGRPVAGVEVDRWRINVNTPQELLEANRHMLMVNGRREPAWGMVEPAAALGRPDIAPGATVGPYVSCGEGCVIEGGAQVAESILLDRVTVGAGARVSRAIIGNSAHIAPAAVVRDQVVADSAVVS